MNKEVTTKNLLGKIGASISHLFIYKGFGISSFVIPVIIMLAGLYILLIVNLKKIFKSLNWGILGMIWIATTFGFLNEKYSILAGTIGVELNDYLSTYLGNIGLIIILVFGYSCYAIIRFKITPEKVKSWFPERRNSITEETATEENIFINKTDNSSKIQTKEIKKEDSTTDPFETKKSDFELSIENLQPTIKNFSSIDKEKKVNVSIHVLLF